MIPNYKWGLTLNTHGLWIRFLTIIQVKMLKGNLIYFLLTGRAAAREILYPSVVPDPLRHWKTHAVAVMTIHHRKVL